MKKKLITVITVVFNARETLEETIKSVLNQDDDLVEYCIVDGGSTDGTIELIRRYEDRLGWWSSEPDKGIYDAMNKGIDRANGKWLYFLGGDDILEIGILKKMQSYLDDKYIIVFGNVLFDNGYKMRSFLGKRTLFQNTVHHQSAFYNSDLFNNFRYNTKYLIASEYDIHLKIYLNKFNWLYVPLTIAKCALGGASSNLSISLTETNSIRSIHLVGEKKNKFLSILLRLYYLQKKVRFKLYGHRV